MQLPKLRLYALVLCLLLIPNLVLAASSLAKMGSRGKNVEEVQAMLQHLKLYKGAVDGVYGNQTLAAVKQFQKKQHVVQNGVVDKKLYKLMSNKSKMDFSKYRKSWIMEASGYSAKDPGCSGITASGLPLRRGLVAVDPFMIPLGTHMYVMGYGFAVARDTGSAIKGNVIDLAFNSRGEALRWGRRRVRVYIF